jgi:hypothetical protein
MLVMSISFIVFYVLIRVLRARYASPIGPQAGARDHAS